MRGDVMEDEGARDERQEHEEGRSPVVGSNKGRRDVRRAVADWKRGGRRQP